MAEPLRLTTGAVAWIQGRFRGFGCARSSRQDSDIIGSSRQRKATPMASIIKLRDGKKPPRAIDFTLSGKRRRVRLGAVTLDAARTAKAMIEALVVAAELGLSPSGEAARWLATIDDKLHSRLAKAALAPEKRAAPAGAAEEPEGEPTTLEAFVAAYIAGRANLKPNTIRNLESTQRALVDFFGADRPIHSITAGEADDWREQLLAKYAGATAGRTVKRAKQFFAYAVRRELVVKNPFADLRAPAQSNKAREHFITRQDFSKLLDACPDPQWRLILALSRIGGLRCPSEHLALTWDCVDWERRRLRVPSPKTEHHAGKGYRIIPLWPELEAELATVFEAARPGAAKIITRYADSSQNLRTQLLRILKRAGLQPWERLFHNLRASRQTELMSEHPAHVVCSWLGNTLAVAASHYLQVTDEHFEAALGPAPEPSEKAQQKAQHLKLRARASSCNEAPQTHEKTPGIAANAGKPGVWEYPLGESNNPESSGDLSLPQAEAQRKAQHFEADPLLAELLKLWPRLSDERRLAVLEQARAACR